MKIVIVGPGAMGTLFAARLAASGASDIRLLDKDQRRAALIRKKGLRVTGLTKIRISPQETNATADAAAAGLADLVVFMVKSFDTANAAADALPCIGRDTILLTLQNGLGNAETIYSITARRKKPVSVLAGTTSEAGTYVAPGNVEHTGKGETVFGHYLGQRPSADAISKILSVFNAAGIMTRPARRIKDLLWSKLVINSAINPLGAITMRRNGELLKEKCLRGLLHSVATESAGVARAAGVKLSYSDPPAKTDSVCRSTSSNYNSMLQDILNGRRTEIDSINGAVIRAADGAGLETPLNKMLYCFVKLMEKSAKGRTRLWRAGTI
jgi:2-dehydropantoate 2-reductase